MSIFSVFERKPVVKGEGPSGSIEAKTLPEQKPPAKLKTGVQTVPKYLGKTKGATISNPEVDITNLDRAIYARYSSNINETIQKLVRTSPDLSHAVAGKISMAITNSFTVLARDEVGRIDVKGTETVQALCQRWNTQSPDYSKFHRSTDLRTVSASLLYDSLRFGVMGAELVLDKARLPAYAKAIPMANIKWADDSPNEYPIYKSADKDIHLNFPTIFVSTTTKDAASAYANSPLETAIQACLHDMEFVDQLRKAAVKNLLQRLKITIDSEQWKKSQSADVQYDEKLLKEKMTETYNDVEAIINGLSPEDALIHWDMISVDTIADANRSEDRSIRVLSDLISGQIASGAKTLPSILGRGEESSASSTESMLYVKALSHIQNELNILFSRILTLAVRLLGNECSVFFEYSEASLRPHIETASFRAVEQSIIMELVSTGYLDDIEGSIMLTGTLPPAGHVPLSGTMFKVASSNTANNDYSNTSATASGKPNDTQGGKEQKSSAATGVKGKNSK